MDNLERELFEKVIGTTESLCSECLTKIPATIYRQGNEVRIRKKCTEHGEDDDIYWEDYEMYMKARRYGIDGKGVYNPKITKEKPSCPDECGLCYEHKSHTALANIVVTNRCDLSCWYCFFYAEKAGYIYEPTQEQIRMMVRTLREEKPIPCNAVQITGGEPTLREDLIDIIKIIKEEGVEHVQLNTDGVGLATDSTLAKGVREAGVNTVYMSFDGVTPKTNPKNFWEVPKALENCRKAELGIVLVPTVINTYNDHEVGAIIRYAQTNLDVVRGINFQPVSQVGRMPKEERKRTRITIPGVIQRIEEQTNGEISKGDFRPVPCVMPLSHFVEAFTGKPKYELTCHFACGMATYAFKDNGRLVPITRFVDVDGAFEYMEEKAREIENANRLKKWWVAAKVYFGLKKFIDREKEPEGLDLYKTITNAVLKHDYEALGDFHHKSLFIGLMHFQDLHNLDLERLKRCDIHYTVPDLRIIPFCAFNVIPEWYRDKIQKEFGMPIEEWERRTGRKLTDDFYKRSREIIQSAPERLI